MSQQIIKIQNKIITTFYSHFHLYYTLKFLLQHFFLYLYIAQTIKQQI